MAKTRETKERPVLTPVKFAQEFADLYPPARALQLLGFCMVYRLAGYPNPSKVARGGGTIFGLKRAAVYRCFQDLRRFRLHLVEQGYELAGLTDQASNTYELGIEELRPAVDRKLVDAVVSLVYETRQEPASAATV
jgi:hypothetical protein